VLGHWKFSPSHIAQLEHIIPVQSQPVFALSEEEANTNSIVFDMTWPGLKPVVYHTKQQTPILWYDLTRSQTRDLSHEAANTNSIVFDMTW
jgi:hypothetical protein